MIFRKEKEKINQGQETLSASVTELNDEELTNVVGGCGEQPTSYYTHNTHHGLLDWCRPQPHYQHHCGRGY